MLVTVLNCPDITMFYSEGGSERESEGDLNMLLGIQLDQFRGGNAHLAEVR